MKKLKIQDIEDLKDLMNNSIESFDDNETIKIEKIVDLLEKRVPRAIQKIKTCLAVVSDKKATEMANLEKSVTISKQAYDLAVAKLDIAEPLEGVHTEAWKALFKSAKEFSEKHAYTGKLFPNIEYDAHCVLCMQPLGEDAKDRLSRFGLNYIQKLLELDNRKIEIINPQSNDEDDLMQDFVSIITSFTARLYGRRRSKRLTEKIIKEVSEDNE